MIWDKLFGKAAADLVNGVGKIVDDVVTSDEEKLKLTNELKGLVTGFVSDIKEYQTQIITTEMKGNWLQRSWRPIIMLVFAFIVVLSAFTDVTLNQLPNEFWGLLKIGIGGYIGGRSLEKITDSVGKNMDISFKRKRDR